MRCRYLQSYYISRMLVTRFFLDLLHIDFKSYVDIISTQTPNYDYEWDYTAKTITFYVLCNRNRDFKNIVIKYNIVGIKFQAEFYAWINEILSLLTSSIGSGSSFEIS